MVVPQLESERARFGRASLGEFAADADAARAADDAARLARLRPWLLWTVLVVGVAVLGALVWRLARSGPTPPAPPP
jgi:Mg2+/citrate symporter